MKHYYILNLDRYHIAHGPFFSFTSAKAFYDAYASDDIKWVIVKVVQS